ncbi:enhanced serine sensitivity protein SseB C-terminal domain-containing protein [Streptacidiphilus melanogenes]|uniref:enhanced serine sensitivity protein SseB C-terminal domain-containing protein n=1 Tax=Streptacidiphilus melanogenes TaxID=411235 RepID=UPI0005A96307|nr:enhanced serine sensitivity protein SseB C-terminal domain-containing protein [Streptacidiphilus melanogenes]
MHEYGGVPHQGLQAGLQAGVWPENELELALAASVGNPGATPRVMEVLSRSHVWVPMPAGPTRDGVTLDLPTTELAGQPFVPVFSSETQLRAVAGPEMSYAIAPVKELARGLPQGVGIAVNPEGAVGLPVPAAGVPDLCGDPAEEGVRMTAWEPEPHEEPYDYLAAAAGELAALPVVLTARRAFVQVEDDQAKLFVGVQLARYEPEDHQAVGLALGRALGAVPLPCEVSLVLLDAVTEDPAARWMLSTVAPFFAR